MRLLPLIFLLILQPGAAGQANICVELERKLENDFLLDNDQRQDILRIIAQKSPAQIDKFKNILSKLPPRGIFSADVADYFRKSAPEEVMYVLMRLAHQDLDNFFFKRGNLSSMNATERLLYSVIMNQKWISSKRATFEMRAYKALSAIRISTYVDWWFKNKNRPFNKTYLENYLAKIAGSFDDVLRFGGFSMNFGSIEYMRSAIGARVKYLRDQEAVSTGMQRIHLRKERTTLETYYRLISEQGNSWTLESQQMMRAEMNAAKRRFLTAILPQDALLKTTDKAGYITALTALSKLLYFFADRSPEWLNGSFEVIYDEELGFDSQDPNKELTESEKQYVKDGLDSGKTLEEIFEELKKRN